MKKGLLILAFTIMSGFAAAQSNHEEQLAIRTILDKIKHAYAGCQGFYGEGTITNTRQRGSSAPEIRQETFSVSYERPEMLWIKWQPTDSRWSTDISYSFYYDRASKQYVVDRLYRIPDDVVRQTESHRTLDEAIARTRLLSSELTDFIPKLLRGDSDYLDVFAHNCRLLANDEQIDGRDCLSMSITSPKIGTFIIWIDRQTYAIRRLQTSKWLPESALESRGDNAGKIARQPEDSNQSDEHQPPEGPGMMNQMMGGGISCIKTIDFAVAEFGDFGRLLGSWRFSTSSNPHVLEMFFGSRDATGNWSMEVGAEQWLNQQHTFVSFKPQPNGTIELTADFKPRPYGGGYIENTHFLDLKSDGTCELVIKSGMPLPSDGAKFGTARIVGRWRLAGDQLELSCFDPGVFPLYKDVTIEKTPDRKVTLGYTFDGNTLTLTTRGFERLTEDEKK